MPQKKYRVKHDPQGIFCPLTSVRHPYFLCCLDLVAVTFFFPYCSLTSVNRPCFLCCLDLVAVTFFFSFSSRLTRPSPLDEGGVLPRASLKAVWSRIFWCKGMVVFTPSMCSSASARFMQAMASARVGWWTSSLPIIES